MLSIKAFANEQSLVELIRQADWSIVSIDEQVSHRWLDDFVSIGEKQSDSLVNRRDTYVIGDEILRVCACISPELRPPMQTCSGIRESDTNHCILANRGLHKLF